MDEEFNGADTSDEENKNSISADLIRGHINTIILRTLYECDKYGYEIIEDIKAKSHGQYDLKQPTLYSALKRLESQGFINAYWKTDEVSNGGRRKYYTLTDRGREITEKNQAEWEYSRTVIDSLISDKSFDFSNPAPSPVDFRLLKNTTSRPRGHKNGDNDDEDDDSEREVNFDDDGTVSNNGNDSYAATQSTEAQQAAYTVPPQPIDAQPAYSVPPQPAETQQPAYIVPPQPIDGQPAYTIPPTPTSNTYAYREDSVTRQINNANFDPENIGLRHKESYMEDAQPAPYTTYNTTYNEYNGDRASVQQVREVVQQMQEIVQQMQQASQQPAQETASTDRPEPLQQESVNRQSAPSRQSKAFPEESLSEQRKRHENYMRLISEPVVQDTSVVPDSENIDTEKLIYNNKPEPERDYKNLINNLYSQTVTNQPVVEEPVTVKQMPVQVSYEDANAKANKDGLTVNSSEYNLSGSRRKRYNRGTALFKTSLIVGVILLFEFALSLAFKDSLGVSIGYPIVILAIAVAQVAIFGILTTTDFGKSTRRPTTHTYITAAIVVTILLVLIIFVTSLLMNVNFASASDISAKIIIPSLVALNIPIFALIFYAFSK